MLDHMRVLQAHLDAQRPGHLVDPAGLIACLGPVWPSLAGGRSAAMEPGKLARVENASWRPPVLTFTVERHREPGVRGVRAELEAWTVDIDAATAVAKTVAYRQTLEPAGPPRVASLVREIARLIVNRLDDPMLAWAVGGASVRVAVDDLVGRDGSQKTAAGRRRRFRYRLRKELAAAGWASTGPSTFRNAPAGTR